MAEIVEVDDAVKVFQLALLDVLEGSESAGVPLNGGMSTTVRLTSRLWLTLIFLKVSWNPLVGSISSLNFSF